MGNIKTKLKTWSLTLKNNHILTGEAWEAKSTYRECWCGKIINWVKLEIQKDCKRVECGITESWKEDRNSHKMIWA